MNKLYLMGTAFFLGLLITAGAALAVDKGPEEITLRSTIDPAKKAKPAFFPHAVHQGNFECAKCHHSVDDAGKQISYSDDITIVKCESCHNKASSMPKKLSTFKKIAHELCKKCHVELLKQGEKAGPKKCNGCHRKDLK